MAKLRGAAAAAAFLFSPVVLAAQEARQGPPVVVTSGTGEARATPDRATVTVGVDTRAATAAAAASENARRQQRVIAAVKALGIPAEQITTSGYSVNPETQYDRTGQTAPKTLSYLVTNSVVVELKRTEQAGQVIDAALGAGANDVRGLSFSLSSAAADTARRLALAEAVARAKADADVAARAAGGALGPLIELLASDVSIPRPMPMYSMQAKAASGFVTPVESGQEAVRATVTGRWQFLPR